ncbi:hypothetical protein CAPTEDRAFT_108671 [Capitella teleta]|uniref:Guanylate cyclase n=1 Tax=Capitella teleta TaxID=283909 RepID=R7T4L4_CAPTE|nr:hypothetical protein CAPTEDRAFT_108671 [Capitella teleta]|eukprot:ELT87878.1 hypothetical protein CAPTEDRAFT_108671 [Capitella teleta]
MGVFLITQEDAPYNVGRAGAAIDIAKERVNSELLTAGTHRLVVLLRTYGPMCDAAKAPGMSADLFYKEGVSSFVGPGCSTALDPVARMAAYWNRPIATGTEYPTLLSLGQRCQFKCDCLIQTGLGDHRKFTEKEDQFPTLTRYAYCQCRLRAVLNIIFVRFNWSDISIIVDIDDDYAQTLGDSLEHGLHIHGYNPNVIKFYGNTDDRYKDILQQASKVSRVILLSVHGNKVRKFMLAAYDLGLPQTGEYVFMDVELFPFNGSYWGDHSWRRNDDRDLDAKAAYESILRIALVSHNGPNYERFAAEVKRRAKENYGFDYDAVGEVVNYFVGAFHDAVFDYGSALNRSIELGIDYNDGVEFVKLLWNRSFAGSASGNVHLAETGDRDTSFAILDMDPLTGKFVPVAHYWGDRPGYTPVEGEAIHWAGGRKTPPANMPFCWFQGDNPACKESGVVEVDFILNNLRMLELLSINFHFIVFLRYKMESQLKDMSWIIRKEQIHFKKVAQHSFISRISQVGYQLQSEKNSVGKTAYEKENSKIAAARAASVTSLYVGIIVSIRHINRKFLPMTRDVLLEVSKRRHLLHDNLARFIGVVIDCPTVLVLHEYCSKGSLQDILHNEHLHLDEDFKGSLIGDIVKGMSYIHNSELVSHGHLSSSNCVVDSRFVLKVTDFGLPSIYKEDEGIALSDESKGDVYSFGIILQEIVTRSQPFDTERQTHSVQEIISLVRQEARVPPLRPQVAESSAAYPLLKLMKTCWNEDPSKRPSFDSIKITVRLIQGGKDRSLLESLLSRMEQYANNLEGIVTERTQLLAQEQRKTEQLLFQILPRSIAEQLKYGKPVEPESYERVTIYFSDIVGFTTISAQSSPLEVVTLLNDLYTTFDSIIEKYDVYKVETIGDAYMLVSGLPIRNEDKHGPEMARVSLELLNSMGHFRVRHRPDEKLRLRIGLHTGSCVAGVVGLKMPRYCLFGDTVNTASRMESHGEPLKIHMSPQTKELLDQFGCFRVEERGMTDIKGKGSMLTYWLLGEK